MRILFLDDNPDRIIAAREVYGDDVKIVTTVTDCLRELAFHDWDVVSLDHDLGGKEFTDPDGKETGMEVIRYIEKTGWPRARKVPHHFIIHSSNFFAARLMCDSLEILKERGGFLENSKRYYPVIEHKPFGWKEFQRGVIAGAFDVMHVGYVRMFGLAKERCHHLTIFLHDKPGRVFEIYDRKEILLAMKGVDDVLVYETEDELTKLLTRSGYDVRFLGEDHQDKSSRDGLLKTTYLERKHKWSDSYFKGMIVEKGSHPGKGPHPDKSPHPDPPPQGEGMTKTPTATLSPTLHINHKKKDGQDV